MRLSLKQRGALIRMYMNPWTWKPPRGDGRVLHGWNRTLYSLERLGLVAYLIEGEKSGAHEGPGWSITIKGAELAKAEGKPGPKLFREVIR